MQSFAQASEGSKLILFNKYKSFHHLIFSKYNPYHIIKAKLFTVEYLGSVLQDFVLSFFFKLVII